MNRTTKSATALEYNSSFYCRLYFTAFTIVSMQLIVNAKMMIERNTDKYGWEFIFLGANIDAAKEAARFGISQDRAANYHADSKGTAVIYEAVSEAVCSVRASKPMSADWKRMVDADYRKRGK